VPRPGTIARQKLFNRWDGRVRGAVRRGSPDHRSVASTPPAEPSDEEDIELPVAAVARRLGVAPATLRTWDRRYGLGPSAHEEGRRRRYRAADLARLEEMRRLVHEGVAPADAAAAALRTPTDRLARTSSVPVPAAPGTHGGRVLPLPGATPEVRGLGRAAMALDDGAVRDAVVASIRSYGVERTWDELLRPVLRAAGERWAVTGEGVEVEHLLSDVTAAALLEGVPPRPSTASRPVLLAGAPDELHSLPLHVLRAALTSYGVPTRMLGPALPAAALAAAVRRIGPSALVVWSHVPGSAEPDVMAGLPPMRPPVEVFVAGPGWGDRPPPAARLLTDLAEAVTVLRAAARLSP